MRTAARRTKIKAAAAVPNPRRAKRRRRRARRTSPAPHPAPNPGPSPGPNLGPKTAPGSQGLKVEMPPGATRRGAMVTACPAPDHAPRSSLNLEPGLNLDLNPGLNPCQNPALPLRLTANSARSHGLPPVLCHDPNPGLCPGLAPDLKLDLEWSHPSAPSPRTLLLVF